MNQNTTVDNRIPRSVTASFSTALAGQNLIFGLQAGFLMFAFTDILGLLPATVGTLLLVARVFDAANDPIMGYLTERTRTRWGKFRPWLLISPIPLGLLTVLLFYSPDLTYEHKVLYAYVTYFCWTVAYTLTDIPLWSLTATVSRDAGERTKMITVARVVTLVATIPVALLPLVAQTLAPDSKQDGYLAAVAIMVAVAVPMLMVAFFGIREKVQAPPARSSLTSVFTLLIGNRQLLLLMLSIVLSFMAFGAGTVMPYFVEYVLLDTSQLTVLLAFSLLGTLIGIALTPCLLARYKRKKDIIIWTAVARSALLFFYFFVGYDNLTIVYLISFILGLLGGPSMGLVPVMIGDTIDDMEQKTGIRSEGVAFSAFTFSNKATTGLAAWGVGIILTATGYVANQEQSQSAQDGLFWLASLIPAISTLVSIIPLLFYDEREKAN